MVPTIQNKLLSVPSAPNPAQQVSQGGAPTVANLEPALQPIKKADIKVDPQQLQQNLHATMEVALAPIKKADIKIDFQQMQQTLQASLDHLNQVMRDGGRNLNFAIDPALSGPVITVRKQDTGEVIRTIPSSAAINVAHSIDALKGLLLNAKI